jgi:hypothetical protein
VDDSAAVVEVDESAVVVPDTAEADPPAPVEMAAVETEVDEAVVWLASSAVSFATAEVADACAEATAASREDVSRVASVWPALTACPTATEMVPTVPEVAKLRLAWLTGVTVPTESSVWRTDPTDTVASRYSGPEVPVSDQTVTAATATTRAMAPYVHHEARWPVRDRSRPPSLTGGVTGPSGSVACSTDSN